MSMNYPIFLNIFSIVDDLALTFSCSVKGGEGAFEEVKGGDKQVSEITNYSWGGGGGVYYTRSASLSKSLVSCKSLKASSSGISPVHRV